MANVSGFQFPFEREDETYRPKHQQYPPPAGPDQVGRLARNGVLAHRITDESPFEPTDGETHSRRLERRPAADRGRGKGGIRLGLVDQPGEDPRVETEDSDERGNGDEAELADPIDQPGEERPAKQRSEQEWMLRAPDRPKKQRQRNRHQPPLPERGKSENQQPGREQSKG